MKSKKLLNLAVAYLTALSVFVSPLSAYANTNPHRAKQDPLRPLVNQLDEGPLKDFLNGPETPKNLISYKASDSFLDQDPFFLRGQSWSSSNRKSSTSSITDSVTAETMKDTRGVSLRIGDSAVWTLHQKMSVLYQTDEYIFLTADSEQIFNQKIKDSSDEKSQGVFVVRHVDLLARSKGSNAETLQARVPVFFYPLIGSGWTSGQTRFDEISGTGIVLASNKSENLPLPINLKTLEEAIKYQLLNMTMAAQLNLSDSRVLAQLGYDFRAKLAPAYPLPPRGSTAGFGVFYTGLSLDRPDLSLFKSAGLDFSYESKKLFAKTQNWFLPQAQAFDFSTLDSALLYRAVQTAAIMGGVFFGALLLKQTLYKKKLSELYPETKNGKSWAERFKGNLKAQLTIYSQSLVTFYQSFALTVDYNIEYASDRLLSKFASAKNSWIRKFMESTILFSRNTNQGIPTDHKTLGLGYVFGGVDTLHVFFQLLWIVPLSIYGLSSAFDAMGFEQLSVLAKNSMSTDSSTSFVANELFRNIIGYAFLATLHLAQETKAMVVNVMKPQIEKDMRKDGFDPDEDKVEYKKRMEKVIDEAYKKRALPGKDKLLFDPASIVEKITSKAGYKIDQGLQKELQEAKKDPLESPLQKARWGLITPTLKLAEQHLKAQSGEGSNQKLQQALAMVQEIRADFHVFYKLLKLSETPFEIVEKAKKVRQWITLITYEGSTEDFVQYLPEEWAGLDPDVAQIVASTLRLSFYQLYNGKPLLDGSKISSLSYREKAIEQVKDINDPFLKEMAIKMKIRQLEAKDRRQFTISTYRPPKQDWYGRRQIEKATAITFKKVAQLDAQDPITSEQKSAERTEQEKQIFAKALAEQVGIRFQKNETQTDNVLKFEDSAYQLPITEFLATLNQTVLPSLDKNSRAYALEALSIAHKRADQERQTNLNPPEVFGEISYFDRYLKKAFFEEYRKLTNAGVSSDKEFLAQVDSIAKEKTTGQMKQAEIANHYKNLKTEDEKKEFEKLIYGLNYLDAYRQVADTDMDVYASHTVERPGFWQKVRQSKMVRGSRLLTQFFRTGESFTDTMSLSLGAQAWADRNIPAYSDLKNGIKESAKTYLSQVTYKYLIAFHVFGLTFSYPAYLFFMGTFFIGGAINYWLNRLMTNVGLKPMESIASKVKFATVFSYATAIAYVPVIMFNPVVSPFLQRNLIDPIKNGVTDTSSFVLKNGQQLIDGCAQFLSF